MTENVTVVTDENVAPVRRFDVRKALKITAAATAVTALVVIAKRKLNGSVDGNLAVTVETDSES